MASTPPTEGLEMAFADEFDGPDLDRGVWLPHYLPAWSSLAASAAADEVRDSCLVLDWVRCYRR